MRRESVLIDIGEVLGPEAGVTGRFHDSVHGAADQDQLAVCSPGRFCDGDETATFEAKVVIAIRPFARPMIAFKILGDGFLGGAYAFEQRIGAVADKSTRTPSSPQRASFASSVGSP